MKKFIVLTLSLIVVSSLWCMEDSLKKDAQELLETWKQLSTIKLQNLLKDHPLESLAQLEQTISAWENKLTAFSRQMYHLPGHYQRNWDNAELIEALAGYARDCINKTTMLREYLSKMDHLKACTAYAWGLCDGSLTMNTLDVINKLSEDEHKFDELVIAAAQSLHDLHNTVITPLSRNRLTMLAEGKVPQSKPEQDLLATFNMCMARRQIPFPSKK